MDKTPPEILPEFSLSVRRNARGTEVRAAARGAPAMVLAIATILIAAALAVGWVRRAYGGAAPVPERDRARSLDDAKELLASQTALITGGFAGADRRHGRHAGVD